MKLYKYKNYAEYIKSQQTANKRKSGNIWAKEENIKYIAEYVRKFNPLYGMCHGVRQGWEVIWFKEYLLCQIFGTEIGKIRHSNIIQWDFNRQNPDWIGHFDFIYSNSFDHAFQPELTIQVWAEQLQPNGLIILEYDRRQEHTGEISKSINKTDPVSIKFNELKELIPQWIKGSKVIKILDMPVVTQEWRKAMVVQI